MRGLLPEPKLMDAPNKNLNYNLFGKLIPNFFTNTQGRSLNKKYGCVIAQGYIFFNFYIQNFSLKKQKIQRNLCKFYASFT